MYLEGTCKLAHEAIGMTGNPTRVFPNAPDEIDRHVIYLSVSHLGLLQGNQQMPLAYTDTATVSSNQV